MEFKPINQGWRNILNVHTVAIIELQEKFSSQNVFVLNRKVELYSMEWQDAVDLSRFIVSAAPFGGPIGKYIMTSSKCCLTCTGSTSFISLHYRGVNRTHQGKCLRVRTTEMLLTAL